MSRKKIMSMFDANIFARVVVKSPKYLAQTPKSLPS
jgi:hypothetical protein